MKLKLLGKASTDSAWAAGDASLNNSDGRFGKGFNLTPKGQNRNWGNQAGSVRGNFLLLKKQPYKELLTLHPLSFAGWLSGIQNGELQTVKKLKNWGCEICVGD